MENNIQDQTKPAKPDNYLVWAIHTTLLCCLPFGIVSIVYTAGQYTEAQENADKAKKWAIISAVTGVVVGIIYGILMAVGVADSAF